MQITLKQLRNLIRTLERGSVTEFEYEDEQVRLRLSLGGGSTRVSSSTAAPAATAGAIAAASTPPATTEDDVNVSFVTSPFVGTFYTAGGPDSEPFVSPGAQIHKGQTLCIVEAMKLMNEIEAEFAGTLLEVLVENGASVEFGQKLFKVRRS